MQPGRRRVAPSVARSLLLTLLVVSATGGTALAAPAGVEVPAKDLPAGGQDALVLMDADASPDEIDGVRKALRRSAAVRTFSTWDTRTIRRDANRALGEGVSVDDAPQVRPPPSFLVVDLSDGARASWRSRVERLAGVDRVLKTADGAPDVIGLYAQCVWGEVTGLTLQVVMSLYAPADQIDAVRAALEANADVRRFEFVDKDAAYEEFRRIFRNQPDLLNSISPADLPASFRVAVRAGRRGETTSSVETLAGVEEVFDSAIACDANRALSR